MSFFFLVLLLGIAVICALIYGAAHSARSGPRYLGSAPHKGPVMRFTGTSSEVKDDTGKQRTTRV